MNILLHLSLKWQTCIWIGEIFVLVRYGTQHSRRHHFALSNWRKTIHPVLLLLGSIFVNMICYAIQFWTFLTPSGHSSRDVCSPHVFWLYPYDHSNCTWCLISLQMDTSVYQTHIHQHEAYLDSWWRALCCPFGSSCTSTDFRQQGSPGKGCVLSGTALCKLDICQGWFCRYSRGCARCCRAWWVGPCTPCRLDIPVLEEAEDGDPLLCRSSRSMELAHTHVWNL